ncbi:MAG TPA: hypothetical protein VFW23_09020, partial [Tepidisphaeraceae bacterium]|nr:hypothetical protein [Tepidisphaeraceae bacterium]
HGAAFQRRTRTDGASETTAGPDLHEGTWVKIKRFGDRVTGYVSSNGRDWSDVGSLNIEMPSRAYVGLAVSSHDPKVPFEATFDHVAVAGSLCPFWLSELPGYVVALFVADAVIVVLLFMSWRRRRQKRNNAAASAAMN